MRRRAFDLGGQWSDLDVKFHRRCVEARALRGIFFFDSARIFLPVVTIKSRILSNPGDSLGSR